MADRGEVYADLMLAARVRRAGDECGGAAVGELADFEHGVVGARLPRADLDGDLEAHFAGVGRP